MKRILLVCWSTLLLSACGPARRSEPLKGAARISDPRVERGRLVYMAKCNHCHRGGEAGLGPALNDKPLPAFVTKMQIRTGLGAMPAFPPNDITNSDVDAVIAYMKEIRRLDAKPM